MIIFKINKAARVAAFFIIFCGVFMLAGGVFLTKETLITGKPISDSRGMDIFSTLLTYGIGVYMLLPDWQNSLQVSSLTEKIC